MNKPKTPSPSRILFLDWETYSPVDITERGAWLYAQKANFLLLSYRFSDWEAGRVEFVQNFDRKKWKSKDLPAEIRNHRGAIVAHNWSFEHAIFAHVFPDLKHFTDPANYICTAATARRCGLPGSLDAAAKALKLENQKEKTEGSALIRKYSIPDKTGAFRPIPEDDREKWLSYGGADVLAMCEIYDRLPKLADEPFESRAFDLDKKMNLRGLRIDRAAVLEIKKAYEKIIEKAEKDAEKLCGRETSGVLTVSSTQGFRAWLAAQGEEVDNAQAATLAALAKKTKNKKILRALECRVILAAAGPKKLDSMLNFSDDDGVARHSFFYFGGHTGRWSGRGFQPQNFVRAAAGDWQTVFDELKAGRGDVAAVNSLLRGCIIPAKGSSLVVGDFASIEARALFYLAGARSGLALFKSGADLYVEQAARFYGKPAAKVTKAERQIGKAQILGLGYGMGRARFIDYAATYGVNLTEHEAERAVKLYRTNFPEVVTFWKQCEQAFKDALRTGSAFVGAGERRFTFKRLPGMLRVMLPSGRAMYYYAPKADGGELTVALPRGGLQRLWGGVLVENFVQAYARDLLVESMLTVEAAGLPVVGTVHDEIIVETKKTNAKNALQTLEKAMSTAPKWAPGFPLASECKVSARYGK